jgi:glycosyltransferase involved in cell wall biosynthesis
LKSIGIIVITYNRPADMLALLYNISNLEHIENLVEEIIVVNNKSTADYSSVENFVNEHPQLPIKYILSNENLGVAKGRNFAICNLSTFLFKT